LSIDRKNTRESKCNYDSEEVIGRAVIRLEGAK